MTEGPMKLPLSYPFTLIPLPSKDNLAPSLSTVPRMVLILSSCFLFVIGPISTPVSKALPTFSCFDF
jgi:hypothetical protein